MKNAFFLLFCLCLILSNSGVFLGAVEIEFTGGINYLSFNPDNLTPYSDPPGSEFEPYLSIIGDLSIKNDISASSAAIFNISRDNIFHNSIDFRLATKADYFNFEFGPFIGMTDKIEKPFVGFLGSLEFAYPGVIVAAFNASSTLASQFGFTGEHKRENIGASIGFWLPFMIPSVSGSIKNFTRQINEVEYLRDSLSRVWASFEFYGKSSPVIFRIDGGWQKFSRDYYSGFSDEIKSFFAGFDFRWQVSNTVSLILGGEIPLFPDPKAPMKVPAFYLMPRATAGFSFSSQK